MLPNLGARCRRQYRLNVYAFRAQLNVEPLREKQHKGFRGAVDGQPHFRTQPNDRRNVDNRPLSGLGQTRRDRVRQASHRGHVEGNQASDIVTALVEEITGNRGAGIVDQNPDTRVFPQPLLHGGDVAILG